MEEIWRKIDCNPNYAVSNFGNVRRTTPSRTSKPGPIKSYRFANGYLAVRLPLNNNSGRGKNYVLHRLVAEAFLSNCPPGLEVNHKDGNKINNSIDNLEYVTRKENIRHAFRTGLNKGPRGEKCGTSKLTNESVILIRELAFARTKIFLAKAFRVNVNTIRDVINGKRWR